MTHLVTFRLTLISVLYVDLGVTSSALSASFTSLSKLSAHNWVDTAPYRPNTAGIGMPTFGEILRNFGPVKPYKLGE